MKTVGILLLQAYLLLSALFLFLLFGLPLFGIYTSLFYTFLSPSQYTNPYSTWNIEFFRALAPFVGIIIIYVLFILNTLFTVLLPRWRGTAKWTSLYQPFDKLVIISIAISAPFLFVFGFWILMGTIFRKDISLTPLVVQVSIGMWLLWIFLRRHAVVKIIISLALIVSLFGTVAMFDELLPEHNPDVYGAFTLTDKKGVYLINYDGDYWLTYYVKKQTCWNGPDEVTKNIIKKCRMDLEKKGNTAIIEAPEDLQKYLDKPVRVDGEFVPVLGMIEGAQKEYRQFCTIKPKKCTAGKGNGIWYYSPLKLRSISQSN